MNPDTPLVIVITGPVGAGKSTTAGVLHDLLAAERIPAAMVDMDYLRSAWPHVTRFNVELGYANLATVVPNYAAIGVRTYVLADVVETPDQRAAYARAVPEAEVVIVRLDVTPDTLETRLRGRESPESLAWHLARAPELTAIMESRGIGDHVIPVANRTPTDLAREIFTALGLDTRTRLPG